MILQIEFSHEYPKLYGQQSAKLLAVEMAVVSELDPAFIEYDTVYRQGEHYKLPRGTVIVLTFAGDRRIPFTTVRSYGHQKYTWYKSQIGQTFEIAVESRLKPTEIIQEKLPLGELPDCQDVRRFTSFVPVKKIKAENETL